MNKKREGNLIHISFLHMRTSIRIQYIFIEDEHIVANNAEILGYQSMEHWTSFNGVEHRSSSWFHLKPKSWLCSDYMRCWVYCMLCNRYLGAENICTTRFAIAFELVSEAKAFFSSFTWIQLPHTSEQSVHL